MPQYVSVSIYLRKKLKTKRKKDAIRCYAQSICICSMIPVSKIKKMRKKN